MVQPVTWLGDIFLGVTTNFKTLLSAEVAHHNDFNAAKHRRRLHHSHIDVLGVADGFSYRVQLSPKAPRYTVFTG